VLPLSGETMISEATLPALYAPWLRAVAGGPIPKETNATCDRCAMLPAADSMDGLYFHPDTKCCTYPTDLPNFIAGRILLESDPSMIEGRQTVERRIAERIDIKPSRVDAGSLRVLLYGVTPLAFGRAPALRCHYLSPKGECSVWKHRPSVCATWYCKHVRGGTGARFWELAAKLLHDVERDLAHWCMARLNVGLAEIVEPDDHSRPHVSDLGGDRDWGPYRRLWGDWAGREVEFYQACANLVESLTWPQVLEKCGPRVEIIAGLVRDAYSHLDSAAIPGHLKASKVSLSNFHAGKYRITTYNNFDPLLISERLAMVLRYFDGRPTEEALQNILAERGLRLSPSLVKRLVDFGILEACDHKNNFFPIVS
jgi:Fe-S-cluster containining protein